MEPAAKLLFCHGGGFCKQVWTPIMARLAKRPLLQASQVATPRMVTFDFPYHGTKRDVSQPARLHLDNPASPRVSHPAMDWAKWSTKEVQRQVALLRHHEETQNKKPTPVIGIGHSMGAAALWATEVANPGTFAGLVLFEPMSNIDVTSPRYTKSVDFLVSMTLQRRHSWDSFESAKADILTMRNFARWHPESLEAYASGAVIKVSQENNALDPNSKFALSCHPHIEASAYCGDTLQLTEQEMASVQCPISFQYGELTQLFLPADKQPLVTAYPHLYHLAQPVPNTTHALVMEDPDTCVDRIVEALATFAPFSSEPKSQL